MFEYELGVGNGILRLHTNTQSPIIGRLNENNASLIDDSRMVRSRKDITLALFYCHVIYPLSIYLWKQLFAHFLHETFLLVGRYHQLQDGELSALLCALGGGSP